MTFIVHDAKDGAPIEGAVVVGLGYSGNGTNAQGFTNVTDIPPGAYLVTVGATGYVSNLSVLDLTSAEVLTDRVNLTPSPGAPPSGWTFRLLPGGFANLWPFLLVPGLLVVGGFVWLSAVRANGRESDPDRLPYRGASEPIEGRPPSTGRPGPKLRTGR